MNPFLSKVLVDLARKKLEKKHADKPVSKKQIVPLVRTFQVEISHAIKEYIFIIFGVFSAGFGLKGFLLPNHFIDGGATGISLLLEHTTSLELGILLVVINLPFVLLASKTIGVKFAVKSYII